MGAAKAVATPAAWDLMSMKQVADTIRPRNALVKMRTYRTLLQRLTTRQRSLILPTPVLDCSSR